MSFLDGKVPVSGWGKHWHGAGVAEGRVEGRVEGRAEAILEVLAARALTPTSEQRARILASDDVTFQAAWLRRAVTATTVEAILTVDSDH